MTSYKVFPPKGRHKHPAWGRYGSNCNHPPEENGTPIECVRVRVSHTGNRKVLMRADIGAVDNVEEDETQNKHTKHSRTKTFRFSRKQDMARSLFGDLPPPNT